MRAVLNKSWVQQPTKQQLYGHPSPISQTIQVRKTRHAGYSRRSKDELISNIYLWTLTYGHTSDGRLAEDFHASYLCGYKMQSKEMPRAMNDMDKWRERERERERERNSMLSAPLDHDDDDDLFDDISNK